MTKKHSESNKIIGLYSLLRYPGSKRKLAGYIEKTLEMNNAKPSLYIEPFVGGASIALHLMANNLLEKAVLMDADPWIASFWYTIFFDTDWFINEIERIDVTLAQWKQFKTANPKTIRDQALTCFFLNRTSFSGILRPEVGPLGGREQQSGYKIDCRFNKLDLLKRITRIAGFKNYVHAVWNCSWEEGDIKIRGAQESGGLPKEDVLFYLDPPFFREAKSLYRFYFLEKDHVALRDYLLKLEDKWILSYDMADDVDRLYGSAIKKSTNGTNHRKVELTYSLAIMSDRKRGKEVIISNFEKLPEQGCIVPT